VVDMSPGGITSRLKAMSLFSKAGGFQSKGIDMSAAAITARLRTMSSLTDLCLRLGRLSLAHPEKRPRQGS